MESRTRDLLLRRFGYAFASSANPESLYRPMMIAHVIDGPLAIGPLEVVPFVQNHGPEDTCWHSVFALGEEPSLSHSYGLFARE